MDFYTPTSVESKRQCFPQDIGVVRFNKKSHRIASLFLIFSRLNTINLIYKLHLYPFRNVLQVPLDVLEGMLAFDPLCCEGETKWLA